MVRLPRQIEEQAQRLRQNCQPTKSREEWVKSLYRGKNRWLPFPDDLQAQSNSELTMMLNVERLEAVQLAFAQLGKDEKQAIKAVVIYERSLRNVGTSLGVSAMTIHRW